VAIDIDQVQSPGWWMNRLSRKLVDRRPKIELLDRYYRGNPPFPEGAETAKSAYTAFQKKARLNLAELCVDAVLDRMIPVGFQTGAARDENGDDEARRIWVGNELDVESTEVHRSMLVMRNGYVIVGGPDEDTGVPVITAEDPRQVVTVHDPVRQQRVRAALKLFHDPEEQSDFAYLYLPGRVFVARREVKRTQWNPEITFSSSAWDWDDTRGGGEGESLPDGNEDVVPVIRFRNKRGVGEFETHLDLLDRINHMILQRMVIATFQAFKQRAIKVDPKDMPEKHPETGEVIDYDKIFSADPGALWKLPQTAELWESGQVDLTPVLNAVKEDKQDFAAATRTPLYYMFPDAANGSAEGASTMREGHVFKAEDRIRRASSGWNRAMSLAFRFMGDEARADLATLRTLWQPAERYSLSERADAASKATDVPWRTKMTTIWQYPPERVAEMEIERASDALDAALRQLPAEPAAAAQPNHPEPVTVASAG
jgi:hypothetical protein